MRIRALPVAGDALGGTTWLPDNVARMLWIAAWAEGIIAAVRKTHATAPVVFMNFRTPRTRHIRTPVARGSAPLLGLRVRKKSCLIVDATRARYNLAVVAHTPFETRKGWRATSKG
jgi:hypothetical protein